MTKLLSCFHSRFSSYSSGSRSWKRRLLSWNEDITTALNSCPRLHVLRARPEHLRVSSIYNSLALEIPDLPSEALRLCGSLRGGKLSFKQRAERAWTAGYWARFCLQGRVSKPRPTTPCDLANTTYVVLRAAGVSSPVRVEKASDYRALLGDFSGSPNTSVSHGFASKAEARVYCLGADVPYPEQVYQWS